MWDKLRQTFLDSFFRPRDAAANLLALNIPLDVWLPAAGLASAIGAIFGVLLLAALRSAFPGELPTDGGSSPLVSALLQFASIYIFAGLAYSIGRTLGGRGSFGDAVAISVWMALVQLVLEVAVIVAFAVLLPLAPIVLLVVAGWSMYILAAFIAVLHGFENLGKVILCLVGILLALTIVLLVIGGSLQQA